MPYDVIVGRNESDKKAFGKKGLIFLGKSYVTMGQYTSLSNPVYMDVARSHVMMIAGKRGSGKSYTLGGMAEAIASLDYEDAQNVSSLIFDTMGIFWTMKFKNHKDKALLAEWGLEEKNIPVRVFVPFGFYNEFRDKGIPVDAEFAIRLSDLEADDWISLFGLKFTDVEGVLIETIVSTLKQRGSFSFEDIRNIAKENQDVSQDVRNAVISLFNAAETWKLFDEKSGTPIKELIVGGKTSIIDLSMYASSGSFNVRGLVIGLVCKKLFNERMSERRNEEIQAVQRGYDMQNFSLKREMPLVWIFIDEAHEFLPRSEDGKTPATDALIQLLREGRQPGISLVLATQQPGKIHTDAMTQSDIVLSHRVTAEQDVAALNSIMQTYLYEGIKEKMNNLPHQKGSAILLDDNSERIYPIRVRPRFTWHGGDAPSAVTEEKIE